MLDVNVQLRAEENASLAYYSGVSYVKRDRDKDRRIIRVVRLDVTNQSPAVSAVSTIDRRIESIYHNEKTQRSRGRVAGKFGRPLRTPTLVYRFSRSGTYIIFTTTYVISHARAPIHAHFVKDPRARWG